MQWQRLDRQRRALKSLLDREPDLANDAGGVGPDPLRREIQWEDPAGEQPVVPLRRAILILSRQVVGTGYIYIASARDRSS